MGSTEPCLNRIETGEGSVIYAYADYSVEYVYWGSHFKALEVENGFRGAYETCELTVFARPGHRNYVAYKGNYNDNNLPNWWVAA